MGVSMSRIAALTAALHVGIDLASGPDQTVRWQSPQPKKPDAKKRAKVKAARKQRNRK